MGREESERHGVESLLKRGVTALDLDGDLHASRRWFDQMYLVAERSGDRHTMTQAVLGLAGLWVHEHRATPAAVVLRTRLEHALSLAEPGSRDALRLRVRMAGENDYRDGAHATILSALDAASAAGDPVARASALSLAHHCVLGPDHGSLRLKLATELIAESILTGSRSDLLMGMLWRTVDLFLDADPHAERSLGELRDLLAEHDHLAVGFVVSAIEVMLTIRAGRFDEAEGLIKVCADRGEAAGDIDTQGWFGGQLFALRWYQGRLTELLPLLDELVHSPSLSVVDNSYFAALAVAAAHAGDRRKAAGALARLCGADLADLPRSSTWLVTMSGVVETAYLLGDAAVAIRAYELLRPYGHLPIMASLGIACFGSAQYALGTAALAAGDVEGAVRHLREAIDQNLALAHWPAAMMSRLRYAQALALRCGPDDARTARQEVATAAVEAAAFGIPLPGEAAPDGPIECTRQGRTWQVALGGHSVIVEHSIGMLHLAVLIANPRQEIPAIDLVAGVAAVSGVTRGSGSAQPVLDRTAVREYRQRIAVLDAQIAELDERGDTGRAERARADRDWLTSALSGASAIGLRTRQFTDDPERARIAVGKAIRRAIIRIAEKDVVIGESLRGRIRTGIRCSYWPR